jgi:hypothetical protein
MLFRTIRCIRHLIISLDDDGCNFPFRGTTLGRVTPLRIFPEPVNKNRFFKGNYFTGKNASDLFKMFKEVMQHGDPGTGYPPEAYCIP